MPIAVMFPGQGTQAPGLGRPWRDHPSWTVATRAEEILSRPLAPLLLDDDAGSLATTEGAQLAVFLASVMAWQAAADDLPAPVALAGHSLGQVTALVAAGTLTVDDGIRLVGARAAACQRATERRPGAMAALLGATPEQADEAVARSDDAWVANDNGPGQIVIAGTPSGVDAASARAKAIGIRRVMPLDVAGAFHTPLMEDAAAEFGAVLADVSLHDSAVPVISNEDGAGYTDGDGWRTRLSDHLVRPVRWLATLRTLAAMGVDELVEIGPGTTLASLARRALPDLPVRSVNSPEHLAMNAVTQ